MEFSYSLVSSLMWRGIKYVSLQKGVKTLVTIRFELEQHITTMSDMKQRISMDEIVVICEDVCGSLFMEAFCTWRWACHFYFSRASWENNAEHELGKNEDRPEFVKINRNPYGQTGTHICVITSDFDKLGGLQKELELSPRNYTCNWPSP